MYHEAICRQETQGGSRDYVDMGEGGLRYGVIFSMIDGTNQGWIQDFKLGGALKKNRAERREVRKYLGYFVCKITI